MTKNNDHYHIIRYLGIFFRIRNLLNCLFARPYEGRGRFLFDYDIGIADMPVLRSGSLQLNLPAYIEYIAVILFVLLIKLSFMLLKSNKIFGCFVPFIPVQKSLLY